MTEKELRKLNRFQLLELLILQTERADKLQAKLDTAEGRLNAKDINMTVLGSIAEASLQLTGVFEAAQKSADLYLELAKNRADEEAAKIIADAKAQAEEILAAAGQGKRR